MDKYMKDFELNKNTDKHLTEVEKVRAEVTKPQEL